LTNDIKQNEEFAISNENPPGERKQVEDNLAQLRTGLSQLENEEQQRQIRVMQVEDQLRTERTKLGELQEQLDRMDKILESSNQQTGPNPR
jgi:predicted nuclease with TOPRIM domain